MTHRNRHLYVGYKPTARDIWAKVGEFLVMLLISAIFVTFLFLMVAGKREWMVLMLIAMGVGYGIREVYLSLKYRPTMRPETPADRQRKIKHRKDMMKLHAEMSELRRRNSPPPAAPAKPVLFDFDEHL